MDSRFKKIYWSHQKLRSNYNLSLKIVSVFSLNIKSELSWFVWVAKKTSYKVKHVSSPIILCRNNVAKYRIKWILAPGKVPYWNIASRVVVVGSFQNNTKYLVLCEYTESLISSKHHFLKSKLTDTNSCLANFNNWHAWLPLIIVSLGS